MYLYFEYPACMKRTVTPIRKRLKYIGPEDAIYLRGGEGMQQRVLNDL
jgi:hypothetical protein